MLKLALKSRPHKDAMLLIFVYSFAALTVNQCF